MTRVLWLIATVTSGLAVLAVHAWDDAPGGLLGACLGIALWCAYQAGDAS